MKDLSEVPRINSPNKNGVDIFIQAYFIVNGKREPFFRFGGDPTEDSGLMRHRDLVRTLLEEAGVEFETFRDCYNVECPAPVREGVYEIVGAGGARERFEKDENGGYVRKKGEWIVHNQSASYENIDPLNQQHMIDMEPYWTEGIKLEIPTAA